MTSQPAELHVTDLLRYVIASSDMYYAEMEQRDVYLACDERGNIRIWAKISDGESSTTIDLFQIFLEYALYCCSWSDMEEACYHMQDFGERLGRALAKHLGKNVLISPPDNPAIELLKHIFEAADACPSIEHVEAGIRFTVTDYPLEKAAERCGLRNVELARHGINTMCQTLTHGINPNLILNASSDARSEFIFTIMTPTYA